MPSVNITITLTEAQQEVLDIIAVEGFGLDLTDTGGPRPRDFTQEEIGQLIFDKFTAKHEQKIDKNLRAGLTRQEVDDAYTARA